MTQTVKDKTGKHTIKRTIVSKEGQKIDEFTVKSNGKNYDYKIQEPTFEQIAAALTESSGFTGKLNMAGGGKVIFELCCLEHDPEIETNMQLLVSICLDLYDRYVLPANNEIKKK